MNQSYPKGAYPDLPPPEKTSGIIKWVKSYIVCSWPKEEIETKFFTYYS